MNISPDVIKEFFKDRLLASLAVGVILLGVIYIIYVGFALEPSDLQVATRYTAFGDTHFYRNKWHYLLSFIVFGVTLVGVHTALSIKLNSRGHRSLAVFLLAFTVFMLVIGWIITRSVLRIAFL